MFVLWIIFDWGPGFWYKENIHKSKQLAVLLVDHMGFLPFTTFPCLCAALQGGGGRTCFLHLRLKSAWASSLLGRPPGSSKPHYPAMQGPWALIPCEKSPAPPQNNFPPNPLSHPPHHKVGKRRKNSGSRGCRQEKKKKKTLS